MPKNLFLQCLKERRYDTYCSRITVSHILLFQISYLKLCIGTREHLGTWELREL